MTLHFHWLHGPHWLPHAHVNRAMALVLGVIGVSLLFGALRVIDGAVSGGLVDSHNRPIVDGARRTGGLRRADPCRAHRRRRRAEGRLAGRSAGDGGGGDQPLTFYASAQHLKTTLRA